MASGAAPPSVTAWHSLATDTAAAQLGTDPALGLSEAEVAARLERHGPNQISEAASRSKLRMLLAQFTDFMILLLVAAAIVSGFIGDVEDTIVILGIVVLNAAVGFVQEFRADRAMAALKQLASPSAMVVRDGRQLSVSAEALVPGDVVILRGRERGSGRPAPARSGRSAGWARRRSPANRCRSKSRHGPDRRCRTCLWRIATTWHSRARPFCTAAGAASSSRPAWRPSWGASPACSKAAGETRTPLQRRLAVFGRQIAIAALAICVVILLTGLLRGEPPLLMLLTALSLAVAAIPEALPAVVTVLLALGAGRMARANALIRRLPAVETLGSVTFICSDKTGTLTRNEMRAVEAFVAGERVAVGRLDATREPAATLLLALALCNDVVRGPRRRRLLGDPTEVALWRAAARGGHRQGRARAGRPPRAGAAVRLRTQADDDAASGRGGLHRLHQGRAGVRVRLLSRDGDGDRRRSPSTAHARCARRRRWRRMACGCSPSPAGDGTRCPTNAQPTLVERDLTLLGLVGLLDPPREEAKAAVATCRTAGITPVMITGDHPVTARAIARQLGILRGRRHGADRAGAAGAVRCGTAGGARGEVRVYARVDPAQKIRIVEALQDDGEIVAMTGDGVNDAPALARADIGVAMGKVGTDVAREAASLVLLDDNFATIVAAVREGRRIYDNIRKFIRFVVTCNSAEIWTIFLAPFLGLPLPLLPIQILWINLVTDGLPGLALAAEPAERDVMQPAAAPAARGPVRARHGCGRWPGWAC